MNLGELAQQLTGRHRDARHMVDALVQILRLGKGNEAHVHVLTTALRMVPADDRRHAEVAAVLAQRKARGQRRPAASDGPRAACRELADRIRARRKGRGGSAKVMGGGVS